MLSRSLLSTIGSGAVLCGCVSTYTTEGAANTALVRLTSNYEHITAFDQADLSQCPGRVIVKRLGFTYTMGIGSDGEVSPLQMIGTSTKKEPLIRERRVVAGEPLLMHLSANQVGSMYVRSYHCGLGLSFTPQPNEQYEVAFSNFMNRCSAAVYRLGQDASGKLKRTPEPTAKLLVAGNPDLLCPR